MKRDLGILSSVTVVMFAMVTMFASPATAREQEWKFDPARERAVTVSQRLLLVKADEGEKPSCDPAHERSCANQCNGEWGMLCPFSTVCDPIKHRCEKAQP